MSFWPWDVVGDETWQLHELLVYKASLGIHSSVGGGSGGMMLRPRLLFKGNQYEETDGATLLSSQL